MRSKKGGSLHLKDFDTMEPFRKEREKYLDDYNHRRIKSKLKGLPLPNTESKPLKGKCERFSLSNFLGSVPLLPFLFCLFYKGSFS